MISREPVLERLRGVTYTATDHRLHVATDPAILYFGTPVVLVSTVNPDETANLAPISSAFWLGKTAVIGLGRSAQTRANLERTGEAVLALPSADLVSAVDRLALTTGRVDIPESKLRRGYRYHADKFELAGLTPVPSPIVRPPGVAECPVLMDCRLEHSGESACILTVEATRVHEDIRMPGIPNRIDPDRWRPLIMSFQKFYGLGEQVHPSRLATIDEELYR